jgi:hypothetical protein
MLSQEWNVISAGMFFGKPVQFVLDYISANCSERVFHIEIHYMMNGYRLICEFKD